MHVCISNIFQIESTTFTWENEKKEQQQPIQWQSLRFMKKEQNNDSIRKSSKLTWNRQNAITHGTKFCRQTFITFNVFRYEIHVQFYYRMQNMQHRGKSMWMFLIKSANKENSKNKWKCKQWTTTTTTQRKRTDGVLQANCIDCLALCKHYFVQRREWNSNVLKFTITFRIVWFYNGDDLFSLWL